MQTVLVCTELLIFLSITPLVSGQCSTCLRGRCYDTGQCVLGCVAGYVYEYCDKACPSNCLNSLCHVDIQLNTVSCTDGCKPGFCGVKCSYPCPDGCVTCDRWCGSCNVTLCPERRYGANCSEICSPEYGTCDRESGKCINCIRGYYGDHCKFPCTECFSGPRNIAYECRSGCDVCRNQVPCPEGLFGDKCERRCSLNCGLLDNTAGRLCNRVTGECSTGCVSGYQGLTCNYTCSKHCQSGRCDRATGECSTGCVVGYHGLTCNYTCNKFCVGGVCNQTNGVCTSGCITGYRPNMDMCEQYNNGGTQRAVIIAVPMTLVCLVAGIVIAAAVIWRRRRSRRNKEREVENGEVAEPLMKYEKGDKQVNLKTIQMPAGNTRCGTVDSGTLNLKLEEAEHIFVPTQAFDDVRQTLEENCHVTICGASGEGKTTMALMLGQEYLTQGYELVFVDRPDVFDLGACISSGQKVCLIFDDIFGSDGRSTDVSNVERLCETLKLHIDRQNRKGDIGLKGLKQVRQNDDILFQRSAKKPGRNMLVTDQKRNDVDLAHINSQSQNVRAIFTSKTYNFNEGIAKSKHISMFYNRTIVDLTVNPGSTYSCQEKRAMLVKYKEKFPGRHFENLEEEKVITQDLSHFGFPQTCRLFFESFSKEPANTIDFFRNPIEYLSLEFTSILGRKNEQAAALILVMMCEGELTLPDLETPNRNEKLEKKIVQIGHFTNQVTRSGIADAAKSFRGTFLSREGKLSFAHSSIYDAFAYSLYQFNPTFVLNYCSLDFLFERLRASPTDRKGVLDKTNYLVVKEDYFSLLIERLVSSMEKGVFSKTVAHPIMRNEVFAEMFLDKLDHQTTYKNTWTQCKETGKGLLYWIVRGEGTCLVKCIEEILKIRFTDDDIREALFACVECDSLTLFKLVKDKLVHKPDNSMLGEYLLASAKRSGAEMVKYLIEIGADVSKTGTKKQTFLHLLCSFDRPKVLDLVKTIMNDFTSAVNAPDSKGMTPLMLAASEGKSDIFDLLLSQGADVTLVDEKKNALIHLACIGGNKHIVESVLTPQNINTRGFNGTTPIMRAASEGKSDIFDLLLPKEADVTLVDEDGDTMIHLACSGGNKHIVESVLTPQNINTRGFKGTTPIMRAATEGKSDIFDLLLSKEADVTLVDEDGDTLIHLACIGGNKHIVERVLTPQNINTKGFYGTTPIMMAARGGKSDIFDLLLSKEADVTLVDEKKNTLIHLACIGGNKPIVESVLTPQNINTKGFNGTTPIMMAARGGKSDIFDLLLSQGADVTLVDENGDALIHRACVGGNKHIVERVLTPQNINTRGFNGATPIMVAAYGGKSDIFDLLLSQGADVTLVDEYGNTLIHLACIGDNKHIVERVLTPQNINTRGFNGTTPIMRAASEGKSDIFDLLLPKEADVTLVDEDGDTLIHLACIGGNKHIVESVLTPQNMNTRGFNGTTPIMRAASEGKSDIFDLLLSKEADVTLVDEKKNTLIHRACVGGNKHIVERVLTAQNINTRGFYGTTPIMMAASEEKSDIFDLLLPKEADVTLVDEDGDTLIHLACIGGNKHIVESVLTPQNINTRGFNGTTPIMRAASEGKSDIFDLLLSKEADVTLVDEQGNALIHFACIGGNKHIVERVLTAQNINTRDNHERTPIMLAAHGGKSDIFDLLLSQGADVTLVDEQGNALIHFACIGGNKHIVERVLTAQNINTGGFQGRTPIVMAAHGGKSDIFDLLLSQGADVTLVNEQGHALIHRACVGGNKHIVERVLTPQNINTRGFNGATPIMVAAYGGKSDIFDLLLSQGADVTLVDEYGNTLIHLACIGDNKHIVERVLTPQNINTRGFQGRTPILMAASEGKSDIFDLLLSQGADVTLVDEQGNALIHRACVGGNKHIVERVLTPQNINTRGFNGATPIMVAASEGKSDIFDLLLSQGADVTLVDEDGDTLIHLACIGGNKHIVERVLTPQNINTRGFQGRTPILMAASEGKSDIFDLLLSQGADVTLVDEQGNALIHFACIGGNKHIVERVLTPQNINTRGFQGRTPILMAASEGKSDIFDLLLSQGADVTLVDEQGNALIHRACVGGNKHIVERVLTPQNINTRGFNGATPIMVAASEGKSDIFDLLLSQGADVTLVDEDGDTLIHLACIGGNKHIVERVLTPQNINTRGFQGRTPILMAASEGKSDIFDLLLSQGADVTLVDEQGNALIHRACVGGNKHIVERVLTPQNINTRGFNGATPIMVAASEGKSDIFDLLLSQGADVTLVDEQGHALIHRACVGGNKHIVERVLTPQNINTRGFNGATPIMVAAYGGKSDIFDLLLSQGADVTLVDEYGNTLIHLACIGDNKHIVERVLTPQNINTRGFQGRTPILMAAYGGKSDIFDLLLSQGADVTLVDEQGNALIHRACVGGNKHIVERVLTPQNINTRGFNGTTPIMVAASEGKSDIFDLLLSQGADVTLVDEDGDTLIHLACIGGNKHIVERVLTPQNINTRGFNGATPIMVAASEGKSDIFDLLLSQGADVTLVDEEGNALIHHACGGGNKHIVERVLTPQNINTRNKHGSTPIMIAAEVAKSDTFNLLFSREVNLTFEDGDGDTLLHLACYGGNKQIVESVLTPHNINTRNNKGMTPIMAAAHEGHINTVAYLCEQGADLTCVDTDERDVVAIAEDAGKKGVVEYLEKLIDK